MFTVILDPEMPQFLQELLEPKIKQEVFFEFTRINNKNKNIDQLDALHFYFGPTA